MDAEHPAFDASIAPHARIYDYLLGGKDNYAADRKAGDALKAAYPTVVELAQANRAFLGRWGSDRTRAAWMRRSCRRWPRVSLISSFPQATNPVT